MITDEASAQCYVTERWGKKATGRLEALRELLVAEAAVQNLISAATIPHVWQRHFADSAQLLRLVPRETSGQWMDLGAGAGFPGLVIALLEPDRPVALVESRTRRIEWLVRASAALGLKNVEVVGERLEAVAKRSVAIISARAFAPLEKTLRIAARFSTSETLWLLPKGRSAQQELQTIGLDGALFHVEQSITDPAAGIIVGHLRGRRGIDS